MAPKVLVIDNYDSFVYNLVQYLGECGADPIVVRNDKITLDEADGTAPDAILISPGPGHPSSAQLSNEILATLSKSIPTLGVCLGHQCIGEAYGATVIRSKRVMHGKTSLISHDGRGIFKHIESPIRATRYHSLIIDENTLPGSLTITARSDDGIIMGVRHRDYPIEGLQFHPESILTEHGHKLISNFLDMAKSTVSTV